MKKDNGRHLTTRSLWKKRAAVVAVIAAPTLLLASLLAYFAINVPFWDQWELVPLINKMNHGTLAFGDVFAQHNEHRIFFPRLIMLGLAFFTHWDTNFEVAANVVLACMAFVFVWLILRRTFINKKILFAAAIVVSLIFFSPVQQENWMWGWQIQWFTNILGLLIAVWSLGAWRTKSVVARLVVGILGAVLATFSIASGIFVWLVCLPLLWLKKELKPLLPYWIGSAVLAAAAYYIGYHDPGGTSKFFFVHEPVMFAVYLLVYYARPLVIDFLVSLPIAFAYLSTAALNITYIFRNHKKELTTTLLPWLCVAGYSLLAGVTTDLSRLGLGIEQAYSSRYTTLSSLLLISVVVVTAKMFEKADMRIVRSAALGSLAVITLLVGLNYVRGIQQMKQAHDHLVKVRECVRTAKSAEDNCLLIVYPNKQIVWERLEYLRSIHWSGL